MNSFAYIRSGIPLVSRFVGLKSTKNVSRTTFNLDGNHGYSYRAHLYQPHSSSLHDLPLIYIQHGMGLEGIDDSRMDVLCRNVSSLGYLVVAPELAEVKNLLITEKTVVNIEYLASAFLEGILGKTRDSISYLSVSFSGGMGLIALSRPHLKLKINSIMLIGTYGSLDSTVPYVLSKFEEDSYGTLIFFRNFFHLVETNDIELHQDIFFELAKDNGFRRLGDQALGEKKLQSAPPYLKETIYSLLRSQDERTSVGECIRSRIPEKERHSLSPVNFISEHKSPISFLHGDSDPVISPKESQSLHELYKPTQNPCYLELSQVISHGDQLPLYNQIGGLPGVSQAFGFFFFWIQDSMTKRIKNSSRGIDN